jgi:hypothetical protein
MHNLIRLICEEPIDSPNDGPVVYDVLQHEAQAMLDYLHSIGWKKVSSWQLCYYHD